MERTFINLDRASCSLRSNLYPYSPQLKLASQNYYAQSCSGILILPFIHAEITKKPKLERVKATGHSFPRNLASPFLMAFLSQHVYGIYLKISWARLPIR